MKCTSDWISKSTLAAQVLRNLKTEPNISMIASMRGRKSKWGEIMHKFAFIHAVLQRSPTSAWGSCHYWFWLLILLFGSIHSIAEGLIIYLVCKRHENGTNCSFVGWMWSWIYISNSLARDLISRVSASMF